MFKKCCTRAFYNSRFGKNDANNFYNTNYPPKRKNDTNNKNFLDKFIIFFKCCSCCLNNKNQKTLNIQNDQKQANTLTEKQTNDPISENNLNVDKTNLNRNNFIIFSEEIQEFSYIDNEPISVDSLNLKCIEKTKQPVISPQILNSIEPVSLVNENKLVLNVDQEDKLDLLNENYTNKMNSESYDMSSSPETVSSSERSRVVARKKIFFKLKKDKTKSAFEKEFESEPLNALSNKEVVDLTKDINSDTRLNSLREKSGFSIRKSFFKSKKLNNKAQSKFDSELEQLNLGVDKKPSLLKTIMDENDEDSDCTYTNTDTTSTKQNSIYNENSTSVRHNSKFKRIFSKKYSKGGKSPSSNIKDLE